MTGEYGPRPGWWRRWRRYDRDRVALEALSEAVESDRLSPAERINAAWKRSFLRMTHAVANAHVPDCELSAFEAAWPSPPWAHRATVTRRDGLWRFACPECCSGEWETWDDAMLAAANHAELVTP